MTRSPMPLRPEIQQLIRLAWKPVTREGDGALEDSKFSGRAWIPADEEWPRCPNCSKPMQLFLQLNCAQFPHAAHQQMGLAQGLIQLFYCTNTNPCCEAQYQAWLPFSRTAYACFIERTDRPVNAMAREPLKPLPVRRIVDWEPMPDYPDWEDLWRRGIKLTPSEIAFYDRLPADLCGDKLGGWPNWIQGSDYPVCPDCKMSMELVFQFGTQTNLRHMFGDMGCGYLTRCPRHPFRLAFSWASS